MAAPYRWACSAPRPPSDERAALEWARGLFAGASWPMRAFLLAGWLVLTCRLDLRRSPQRVLGWKVSAVDHQHATMQVRTWIGMISRLYVAVDAETVTVTSEVDFTGPASHLTRALWRAVAPVHERTLRHLLAATVAHAGVAVRSAAS